MNCSSWHRHARLGIMLVFGVFLTGCTSQESSSQSPYPSPQLAGETQSIEVVIQLPEGQHSEKVKGWVTNDSGERIAEFTFEPRLIFLEQPSGENNYRVPTQDSGAPMQLRIELPNEGTYRFELGRVMYWGGCGTCGRFYEDGSVEKTVTDGDRVLLDLGEVAGEL